MACPPPVGDRPYGLRQREAGHRTRHLVCTTILHKGPDSPYAIDEAATPRRGLVGWISWSPGISRKNTASMRQSQGFSATWQARSGLDSMVKPTT